MLTPLLEVKSLGKSFGGFEAIKDVSFSVQPGQVVALIGPNGAGKSTTFNCVNGQLMPTKGEILLNLPEEESADNIFNITESTADEVWRLGVGRTFQITETFLSMSVRENVQMVLLSYYNKLKNFRRHARGMYIEKAQELLERVGLEGVADQACSILAYGDLKRLELAMALANKPKLLLMDEPTAGMGALERFSLMELTHTIANKYNIGVLFTEHDMETVFRFADRIVVMNRGELIAQGDAEAIQNNAHVKEVYLGGS